MSDRLQKYLPAFLGILVISNLVFLDFYLVIQKKTEPPAESLISVVQPTVEPNQTISNCSACQSQIQKEISKQILALPTSVSTLSPTPTSTPVLPNNPKVLYVPLVNTGSTVLTDWTDIPASDFYFNQADYPGYKSIQWEASLKSVNSPARVMVRLYDVTNKRGVDYSELQTQSLTYALLQSSALTIWRGNNLYRVQLKADNGTEASLGMGRLKIGY